MPILHTSFVLGSKIILGRGLVKFVPAEARAVKDHQKFDLDQRSR